ncbi:hypothetical protein LF41_2380 [Lysobacter dokdonensis DS-58]|uniref:Uncharacterized protein n=1 Tax=Lysobacter dokdonensis DS-58 TaxID=1300345 RepID=A0A0A2WJ75_9GAMM|nr:hypothetical protein [Lysobacter dokdonensis]KGQ19873.1 hypothetical protein LF41_2380 [Lysobacter dokdonensis DS-58]
MNYFTALVANGTKPEHAAVLVQMDELARFANREHPSYGRMYEAEQIADAAPTTDFYERD